MERRESCPDLERSIKKIVCSNSSRPGSPLPSNPCISSGRASPGLLLVASPRPLWARRAGEPSSPTCSRCPFRSGWGDQRNVWARPGGEAERGETPPRARPASSHRGRPRTRDCGPRAHKRGRSAEAASHQSPNLPVRASVSPRVNGGVHGASSEGGGS